MANTGFLEFAKSYKPQTAAPPIVRNTNRNVHTGSDISPFTKSTNRNVHTGMGDIINQNPIEGMASYNKPQFTHQGMQSIAGAQPNTGTPGASYNNYSDLFNAWKKGSINEADAIAQAKAGGFGVNDLYGLYQGGASVEDLKKVAQSLGLDPMEIANGLIGGVKGGGINLETALEAFSGAKDMMAPEQYKEVLKSFQGLANSYIPDNHWYNKVPQLAPGYGVLNLIGKGALSGKQGLDLALKYGEQYSGPPGGDANSATYKGNLYDSNFENGVPGGGTLGKGSPGWQGTDFIDPNNPDAFIYGTNPGWQFGTGGGGGITGDGTGTGGGTTGGGGSGGGGGGDDYINDPSYQFRLDEGKKALEQSMAAKGLLQSGRTLKELERYAQDYASTEWNKEFQRRFQTTALGQQAAIAQMNAIMGMGVPMAQGIGNYGNFGAPGFGNIDQSGMAGYGQSMGGAAGSLGNAGYYGGLGTGGAFGSFQDILEALTKMGYFDSGSPTG